MSSISILLPNIYIGSPLNAAQMILKTKLILKKFPACIDTRQRSANIEPWFFNTKRRKLVPVESVAFIFENYIAL